MDLLQQNVELAVAEGVGLEVRRFRIEEAMSDLFAIQLLLKSRNEDIDLEAIVGKSATVTISGYYATSKAQGWSGVVRNIAQTRVERSTIGLSTYEAVIVPRLWLLSQRRNNRHFQHISIPNIVRGLLEEWQISADWRIEEGRYPDLELRMQYEETDLAFVRRLLEEAGIAFYFEHDGAHDSRLVLHDRPQQNSPRAVPLSFVDQLDEAHRSGVDWANEIRVEHRTRPGRVSIRDYDFRRPRFALFASSKAAPGEEASYEQYRYRPSDMLAEGASGDGTSPVADDLAVARFAKERGDDNAQKDLDALRGDKRRVSLRTNAFELSPGQVFAVVDHPRSDLGGDIGLLVLGSVTEGEIGEEWAHRIQAGFASHPYRPPRVTPKPRVFGTQSAVVVGPEGEEIYVDEFGRVRVQFHWDRHGGYDPKSSIWMRVSQGWSGTGWGMMVIPRVGHEVLVDFLDGDVDSPIIVGRVYNALQRVPYKLPDNKTVSCWRTDSTPGGDGNNYNEIKFEDQKDRELIYVQAERDRAKLVKEDETVLVGRDRTSVVQHDEITAVQNDRTKIIHRDEHSAVGQDRIQQVRRDEGRAVGRDDTTVVLRDSTLTVGKNGTTNVAVDRTSRVGNHDRTFVGSRMTLTMAPGLGESVADGLGDVLDTPVGEMLGPVQSSLAAKVIEAAATFALGNSRLNALSDFLTGTSRAETPILRHLQGPLRRLDPLMPRALADVLALAASPERRLKKSDGMPAQATSSLPPTEIDMVNRRIRLTTGQATITLDGPDIRIEADRDITLVSNGRVKLKSVNDEVAIYGGPQIKLNPGSDGDRPHPDREAQPPVAVPEPVAATQRPTGADRAAIGAALADNDVDMAIDLTVEAMNIDIAEVASIQYEPNQAHGASTSIAGDVVIGSAAAGDQALLASAIVHAATQAKLAAALREAGHDAWPPGEDAALYADAKGYEAELEAAPNTGLADHPAEHAFVQTKLDEAKEGMSPRAREAYEQGSYPP